MVGAETELSEEQATGAIKDVYSDITSTLRIPRVSAVFRVLALDPDYLVMAWRALKPNAQTVYFENCADSVRRRAVESVSKFGQPVRPDEGEGLLGALHLLHYANAKVFLAITALRSATNGLQPKLTELPRDQKRQIAPGLPADAPGLPDTRAEEALPVLDDIRATLGTPVADNTYLALAAWPAFLEASWSEWKPRLDEVSFRQMKRELNRTAEEAVTALPFRMNLYPHALRHAGLSEAQLDSVRATLASFHQAAASITLHVAFLACGAEGREHALQSGFPATIE